MSRKITVFISRHDMNADSASRPKGLSMEQKMGLFIHTKLTQAGIPLKPSFSLDRIEPSTGTLAWHEEWALDSLVFEWWPDTEPTSVASPTTLRDRVAAVLRALWRR